MVSRFFSRAGFLAIWLVLGLPGTSNASTVDFENLTGTLHWTGKYEFHSNPVENSGFNFAAIAGPAGGDPVPITLTEDHSRYYLINSKSLTADSGGNLIMSRSDGSAFRVSSIDVVFIYGVSGKVVEFTGTFADGSTITQTSAAASFNQTFDLVGFEDIVELLITGGSSTGAGSIGVIDNIIYGIPGYVLSFDGVCHTECDKLSINPADPVSGYVAFDTAAFTPGNLLQDADVEEFSLTFGTRNFESSTDTMHLLKNISQSGIKVNATGNGITGEGTIQVRIGANNRADVHIQTEDFSWSVIANELLDTATGSGSLGPIDAGATPVGDNVEVTPVITDSSGTSSTTSILLEYSNISEEGETTVEVVPATELQPPPPDGFKLGNSNVYYDFNTTATFGGAIEVCFGYDATEYADESTIRLYHYHDNVWTDITSEGYPDIQQNVVCGTSNTFSFLVPVEQEPRLTLSCTGFESPMKNGVVKVKKNRVLPFKAQLFDSDDPSIEISNLDLAAPPVLQVTYDDVQGEATDVSDYALSAGAGTEGNQFEYIDGIWQYNLKTRRYTAPGTYIVTLESGAESEYILSNECSGLFMIK